MEKYMIFAGIETSCDETSVAIFRDAEILSNVVSSQVEHERWGGIVPELASRAHVALISHVFNEALEKASVQLHEIQGLAVTNSPGLSGALLVGCNFAKGIALQLDVPIVAVNHIEGHIFSGFLEHPDLQFPFLACVISGGHTSLFHVKSFNNYQLVGSTIDDAAGEAFDKIAKMLGLGYPGGSKIDKLSQSGNPAKYDFPRALEHDGSYNFSFSGLKTSVRTFISRMEQSNTYISSELPDICASVQEAIADVVTKKVVAAAREYQCSSIVVSGGVSANSRIRFLMTERAKKYKITTIVPSLEYCTDNAAMIGFVGGVKLRTGISGELTFTANPQPLRLKKNK